MSLRAYARRRGTSATSVLRAIRSGRLKASLVYINNTPQIGNPDLADQEWDRNTDLSRAPSDVKERAAGPSQPQPPTSNQELPVPPGVTAELVPLSAQPGMTVTQASATEKYWKAKRAELDFYKESGDLVSLRETRAKVVDSYALCRTKLLAVPSKAKAAMPELTHVQIAALDALIREALEELADMAPPAPPTSSTQHGAAA